MHIKFLIIQHIHIHIYIYIYERTASSSRSATDLNNYGITQAFKGGRIQFENNQVPHLSITPPAQRDSTETIVHIETQDDKKNGTSQEN